MYRIPSRLFDLIRNDTAFHNWYSNSAKKARTKGIDVEIIGNLYGNEFNSNARKDTTNGRPSSGEILNSDEQYYDAVKAKDVAKANAMVENAAMSAGYDTKLYHGTPNGGFRVFKNWQYFKYDPPNLEGRSTTKAYKEALNEVLDKAFQNGEIVDFRHKETMKRLAQTIEGFEFYEL